MISLISADKRRFGEFETVVEGWRGKSADEKPVRPKDRNGSVFYEMDTRKIYMFDGDTLTWLPQ